jgi:hypothetical protein
VAPRFLAKTNLILPEPILAAEQFILKGLEQTPFFKK